MKRLMSKESLDSIDRYYALEALDTLIHTDPFELFRCMSEIEDMAIDYDSISQTLFVYMMGTTYQSVEIYDKGLELLDSALNMARRVKYENIESYALNDMGVCYIAAGKYEMAVSFLLNSTERFNLKADRFKTYNNLHICYSYLGMQEESKECILKMMQLAQEVNTPRLIKGIHLIKAYVNLTEHSYDSAIINYEKAFAVDFELGGDWELYEHTSYAEALLRGGRLQDAKRELSKYDEKKIAEMGSDSRSCYYSQMYLMDSISGNYLKALKWKIILEEINETINKRANKAQLARYKILFELDQKEETIKNLKQTQTLIQLKLEKRRLVIVCIAIILFAATIMLVLLYSLYRIKSKSVKEQRQLVSELKSTQKELRYSNDELTKISEDLVQKNNELQEEIASKDQFVSMLAHDLRNPLNSIIGFVDLLRDSKRSFEKKRLNEIYSLIGGGAVKLLELIQDILEWSRAQSRGVNYNPDYFNLSELTNSTIDYLQPVALDKNILVISVLEDNLSVYADVHMVFAVLRNLISNAIKFSYSNSQVVIQAIKSKDEVRIEVHDKGIGVSEEAKKNLFKVGMKKSEPGTNNEVGTGLGLVICSDFVKLNNGKIGVESQSGSNTIFWFTLPVSN